MLDPEDALSRSLGEEAATVAPVLGGPTLGGHVWHEACSEVQQDVLISCTPFAVSDADRAARQNGYVSAEVRVEKRRASASPINLDWNPLDF